MPHKCFNPVTSEMAMTFLSFSSESFQMGEMEINIALTFETLTASGNFYRRKMWGLQTFIYMEIMIEGTLLKPFPQHKVNA